MVAEPARVKPFLRWVGSKAKLLPELLKWVPPDYSTFHEPFLGSGALFFALQPKHGAVEALLNATVINSDFRETERRAVAGDFCYFDPPYISVSKTAEFTSYTAGGFRHADQITLRDTALRLKARGVHVLLSNSDTPTTRELYARFELREITRGGGMNSDTTKRARVGELLIR